MLDGVRLRQDTYVYDQNERIMCEELSITDCAQSFFVFLMRQEGCTLIVNVIYDSWRMISMDKDM